MDGNFFNHSIAASRKNTQCTTRWRVDEFVSSFIAVPSQTHRLESWNKRHQSSSKGCFTSWVEQPLYLQRLYRMTGKTSRTLARWVLSSFWSSRTFRLKDDIVMILKGSVMNCASRLRVGHFLLWSLDCHWFSSFVALDWGRTIPFHTGVRDDSYPRRKRNLKGLHF